MQNFNALISPTKLFHLISNVKTETKGNILCTSKISENIMHTFGKHAHRKDRNYTYGRFKRNCRWTDTIAGREDWYGLE